jgi:Patatin-like phospholipase
MKAFFLCSVVLFLTGCSTLAPRAIPPTDAFTEKAAMDDRPIVAVALAGGGSKAAPFALGVLEALIDNGDFSEVDTISSVSGGGYAALFVYARAHEIVSESEIAAPSLDAAFADCLPRRYLGRLPDQAKPEPFEGVPICPKHISNFVEQTEELPRDRFRQQNHLRGFQSLLRKEFIYNPTSRNRGEMLGSMSKHFASSLVTAIPHHVANTLFDWKYRLSPTGKSYDRGIHRTWGRTSAACDRPDCARSPVGETAPAEGLRFEQLREMIDRSRRQDCSERFSDKGVCSLPDWYINATVARSPFYSIAASRIYDFDHVFHFSNTGYGSESLGIRTWSTSEDAMQPNVTVPQAVAASAAFFDMMPSNAFSSRGTRILLGGVQHLFNLSWGHTYKNYNLVASEYARAKAAHNALPFPLYFFDPNAYGERRLDFRLADGGRAENLGAYNALWAGATEIILVDAASDRDLDFEDVCALRKQIRSMDLNKRLLRGRKVADVQIDGLVFDGESFTLAQWCKGERPKKIPKKHLIYRWPKQPVLKGCVLKYSAAATSCTEQATNSNVVANLYLVKPAITVEAYQRLEMFKRNPMYRTCLNGEAEDANALGISCESSLRALYSAMKPLLPSEVVGFMLINPLPFPQHSTWKTTALSSPFVFGAYRSLARHYASYLDIDKRGKDRPAVIVRDAPK